MRSVARSSSGGRRELRERVRAEKQEVRGLERARRSKRCAVSSARYAGLAVARRTLKERPRRAGNLGRALLEKSVLAGRVLRLVASDEQA